MHAANVCHVCMHNFLLVQHFQLIMQTFVLARFEPSLVFVSQVAVQALVHNIYITLAYMCTCILYSGKFSCSTKFRGFRG